jgi:hypothetical protein
MVLFLFILMNEWIYCTFPFKEKSIDGDGFDTEATKKASRDIQKIVNIFD